MSIKPILFSTPMVQAILAGKKSMTRRVIPERILEKYHEYDEWCEAVMPRDIPCERSYEEDFFMSRSRYKASDILWVRETWQYVEESETDGFYVYAADNESPEDWKWRPSIFMPKEAARIFLRVKGVSAERLHDITEDQALKEGLAHEFFGFTPNPLEITARENFAMLWENLNGTRDGGTFKWANNPWVWVIEFERCEKPEGWCGQ